MSRPDVLHEVALRVASESAEAAAVGLLPSVNALMPGQVVDGGEGLQMEQAMRLG